MILRFKTKRDVNGNTYTLVIDTARKVYKRDYNSTWTYSDYVTIGKRDREKMMSELDNNGYTTIY